MCGRVDLCEDLFTQGEGCRRRNGPATRTDRACRAKRDEGLGETEAVSPATLFSVDMKWEPRTAPALHKTAIVYHSAEVRSYRASIIYRKIDE